MLVKYADKVTPEVQTVRMYVQYLEVQLLMSHVELAFRVLLRAATAKLSETKNINTHQNNNKNKRQQISN